MLEFDFRASLILSMLSLRNNPSPILPGHVTGFSTFAFSEKISIMVNISVFLNLSLDEQSQVILSVYRMLSNCHQFLNVFLNLNKNLIK